MTTRQTRSSPIELLASPAQAVDAWLQELVFEAQLPRQLDEAVRYSLLGGGKRLRPALAWYCCSAVDAEPHASLPAGASVELVHAFSLVHDDLPAMDDDDLRRGKPTLHIHAGEAMAILAGDLMLSLAFSALGRTGGERLLPLLTEELSTATTSMIIGQVRDTIADQGDASDIADEETRLRMTHAGKTGALIRAACRMGALCGLGHGADPSDDRLNAVTTYAESVGLMFQIVDDLLDVEQTPEQTGKRTRKDEAAGKLTFPRVLGPKRSRQEVERLRAASVDALGDFGAEADPLRTLADFLATRSA